MTTESQQGKPEETRSNSALEQWGLAAVTTVAVVVGVTLRFWPRSGLWLDEALSVNIAALPMGDISAALKQDGHPPLYYVLLHIWMKVAGDSDWSVRAMSGVIGVVSLPLAYLAGVRLASRSQDQGLSPRRTGLIALAIFATMPFAVRYSAEARMYALVMALTLCGYLLVDSLLNLNPAEPVGRSRLVKLGTAAALTTTALLWTHYWTMWLLAAVGLLALATIWARRRSSTVPLSIHGPVTLVVGLIVGGLAYLPWLPTMTYQAAHTGTPWGEKFGPVSVFVLTLVDFAGARFGVAQFFSYVIIVLIAMAAALKLRDSGGGSGAGSDDGSVGGELFVGSGIQRRIRVELAVLVLTLGLGWAAAAASGNTFASRYAAVIFPLFVLVTAAGVSLLRHPRTVVTVTAAVCVMGLLGALGAARSDRSQTGAIADAIASDLRDHPGQAVVIACPDQLGVSLQRAILADGPVHDSTGDVVPYPTAGDPRFVDWVDYGKRNKASDPAEFLSKLTTRIEPSTTVYLVASPHYKTFEGKCESLAALLGETRPAEQLVALDTSGLDESAALTVFRPS